MLVSPAYLSRLLTDFTCCPHFHPLTQNALERDNLPFASVMVGSLAVLLCKYGQMAKLKQIYRRIY